MRRLLSLCLAISVLLPAVPLSPPQSPAGQADNAAEVEAILARMDAAERVGQLFLVTYYGADIGPDSDIARLISEYHVGGVVLLQANGNFTPREPVPEQVYNITSRLQQLAALGASAGTATGPVGEGEATPAPTVEAPPSPDYIPLFIATEQEGSGWPHTNLISGLTPLASNMAIGATWRPEYAQSTGRVAGEELSALGVNMLFGPPADVLELPQPTAPGDLSTRVFGGEPVWVADMTAAYVKGLHEGSGGRMAVVPRHFPGYGGADRLADDEIPTVRRSQDQLKQSDLIPFLAVMGDAPDPASVAEGVLVGHIRFQGFQGDNYRAATKPMAFDPVALPTLLSIPTVASWRESGGLLITDALGLRGVRRYYQGQGQFPARSIARDAFAAGNDILYLGEFGSNPPVDQTATVVDTIEYFVQRYETDAAFSAQVDASVRRIIAQKLDLYGQFDLASVIPDRGWLDDIGAPTELTFNIARSALTLLEPSQPDQLTSPSPGDQILVFSDARPIQQCPTCEPQPLIPAGALRSAILQSYGPQATGLIDQADVQSFSLAELADYLELGPQPEQNGEAEAEVDELGVALANADWIVFLTHDFDPEVPGSTVLKTFLADSPAAPGARIVVFAMGAPYYLDSTEVSKLTAYYALYAYTQPFIEVAAQALFFEFAPTGASPVSIPAVDYWILDVTSPDPAQIITLSYEILGSEQAQGTPAPASLQPGDSVLLRTGVIQDLNGNRVPDGTPVEFVLNYSNEAVRTSQTETSDGVAEAVIVVDEGPAELRITAISGNARNSETVYLAVSETGSAEIDVLPPDVTPTPSPTFTAQAPTPEPTAAAAPTALPVSTPVPPPDGNSVDFGDLFLSLLGLLVIGGLVLFYGVTARDVNYGLLLALPTVVVGLLAYNYYALMLPGADGWRRVVPDEWGAALITWLGGLLGLALALAVMAIWDRWLVMALRNRQRGERG